MVTGANRIRWIAANSASVKSHSLHTVYPCLCLYSSAKTRLDSTMSSYLPALTPCCSCSFLCAGLDHSSKPAQAGFRWGLGPRRCGILDLGELGLIETCEQVGEHAGLLVVGQLLFVPPSEVVVGIDSASASLPLRHRFRRDGGALVRFQEQSTAAVRVRRRRSRIARSQEAALI
jgi:hypothetical protein